MRQRLSHLLPLCLWAAVTLASGSRVSAQTPGARGLPVLRIPDAVGVNIHFTSAPSTEMKQLQDAGFHFVRMDYVWADTEKQRGQYDFSVYDRFVTLMKQYGVRPLLILDYANPLYDGGKSPHDPDGWEAYARWAAASATHFHGRGVVWEIWNEPNGFWTPKPDVNAYAQMAIRAAAMMRKADPSATILAPGMSGIDLAYFEAACKQGLLTNLTAVSVHPYRGGPPETVLPDYAALREIIRRYAPGHREIPVVSSEWGYTSTNVSDLQQAQYLARQWLTNLSDGIRLSIWYDWHNDGVDPHNGEHNFGTVRNDYQPKPAYLAAQTLTRTLNGFSPARLLHPAPGVFELLLKNGRHIEGVIWSLHAASPIQIPLPHPVQAVSLLGQTQNLTPENGAISVTPGESPIYLDLTDSPASLLATHWFVSPESIVARAGESVPVRVTVENTSDRPVSARFRLIGPGGTPQTVTAVPVPPDGTASVSVGKIIRSDREATAETYRVEAEMNGGTDTWEIPVRISDPLGIEFLPGRTGQLMTTIENPSGEPFSGQLRLNGDSLSREVTLEQGVTQLTLPTDKPLPAGGATVSATLLPEPLSRSIGSGEKPQAPVLLHVERRLTWIPGFGPQPTIAHFTIAADGDSSVPSEVHLQYGTNLAGPAAGSGQSTWGGDELTPPPGPQMKITYKFGPGWRFVRVGPSAENAAIQGKPKELGMWVLPDGTGNAFRCRFTDSTGQTFQPTANLKPGVRGWQWITYRLNDPTVGSWGGAADGVIHYPIHWDSIVLIDNTTHTTQQETDWVANALLEY